MSSTRTLGKGLSALLGEMDTELLYTPAAHNDLRELHINQLHNDASQPRKHFSEQALEELAQSIRENGVLQPILVRPSQNNDGYEIIAGERRWRAAKQAGLTKVPVYVKEVASDAAYTMALIENIQREDLNPIEEAEGYQQLISQLSLTQEQLAQRLGKSRSHITNILRLLQHSEQIREHLRSGRLSTGHAKVLLGIENAEEIAERIIAENWSVRETERFIQQLQKGTINTLPKRQTVSSSTATNKDKDSDLVHLESMMTESLGMRVEIQELSEGGKVIIHFNTLEQLDIVLQKIGTSY